MLKLSQSDTRDIFECSDVLDTAKEFKHECTDLDVQTKSKLTEMNDLEDNLILMVVLMIILLKYSQNFEHIFFHP